VDDFRDIAERLRLPPEYVLGKLNVNILSAQLLNAIAGEIRDSKTRDPDARAALVAIEKHVLQRGERERERDHAAYARLLAKREAASRQAAEEQQASRDAIRAVRARYAQGGAQR
jgi:hypothetical protein